MKISELIEQLQALQAEHGDLPVLAEAPYHGHTRVFDAEVAASDFQDRRHGIQRGQPALVLYLD